MSQPIKSRHGLTRCTACRAHIQAGDRPSATVCPFCGANLRTGRPLISLPSGRGGILAASLLAFSVTACGGSDADTQNETITAEPEQTGDEGPAGGTAQNQNEPTDDPGYAPQQDPVAVEAYGSPPDEPAPAVGPEPAPEPEPENDDSFQQRPSQEHRPAPRYGLPAQLRDRPSAPRSDRGPDSDPLAELNEP